MEVTSNGKKWIVGKQGQIRSLNGTRPVLPWNSVERILVKAKNHVNAKHLPFLSETLNSDYPNSLQRTNLTINAHKVPGSTARIFHNAHGELYYVRLDGRAFRANSPNVPHRFRLFPARYQHAKNIIGHQMVSGNKTNANLLNLMLNKIRTGNNINVSNLKNNEKNRAYAKVLEQIVKKKKVYF